MSDAKPVARLDRSETFDLLDRVAVPGGLRRLERRCERETIETQLCAEANGSAGVLLTKRVFAAGFGAQPHSRVGGFRESMTSAEARWLAAGLVEAADAADASAGSAGTSS